MPSELIEQILNDVSRWHKPLEEIVPVNYGEFFLRKDWFDIMRLISRKLPNTEITLATNGALVGQETVMKLCQIPQVRVINFSVDAYYDETYERFSGLPKETIPKIRQAMAQIKILRPDIRLKVSMVFDPVYQTDLERDLFEWYWQGAVTWNPMLRKPDVWVIAAASAGRPDKKPVHPVALPCRSIFDAIVIGYDGKISSCCFDAGFVIDLGYYKGNLLGSWHGPELTELRKTHNEHRRGEIELCRKCTFA